MEGTLIHDDERSRQVERLTAELSSEFCAKELDDVDALIQAALPAHRRGGCSRLGHADPRWRCRRPPPASLRSNLE
jgi:hypothetical protein